MCTMLRYFTDMISPFIKQWLLHNHFLEAYHFIFTLVFETHGRQIEEGIDPGEHVPVHPNGVTVKNRLKISVSIATTTKKATNLLGEGAVGTGACSPGKFGKRVQFGAFF